MAIAENSDSRMNTQGESLLSRTLADLKRRRVFRVAAAYAVVAWLAIEVSSVVLPALKLPEWTITAVVITAMAGFPITLILTWLFDLTPRGVVRTSPAAEGAAELHRAARVGIDVVVIGVLLAIIAYLVIQRGTFDFWGPDEQSIAVLPFVDVSESGDNEYFSDGISEELLNSLVSIEGLRVAARTSSFAFKGRSEDVRAIGEQLNVRTVLEGSVRRAGDQVRITANLINVDDGFPIWSATYNRRLDDIFAIQDEIARSIVDALKLKLIGEVSAGRPAAMTGDIKAYDLYLLGRHHWHERTPASLARALDLFQQAVDVDPDFALAYTGLADTYLLLDGYGDLSTEEAATKAEPAVARALALDDSLAEAYASLGLLRLNQGDPTAAELALRSAVNLNPNYSMAHMWLGLVLNDTTGPAAALKEHERAMRVDPLHPVITRNLAITYGKVGRDLEAERLLRQSFHDDPDNPFIYFFLSRLHAAYGRLDEAVRWAWWGTRESSEGVNWLGLVLALTALGDFDRAERLLEEAERTLSGEEEQVADKDLLGARVGLYLAQGRFDELGRLGESLDLEVEDHKQRMSNRIWAGVAAIVSDDPAAGTALLEETLDHIDKMGDPDVGDVAGMLALLAYAYDELDDQASAAATRTRALEFIAEARSRGWSIPDMFAWEAIILNMAARPDEAHARLQQAVARGWRGYVSVSQFPPAAALFADPALQDPMEEVRADLARMLAAVRDLDRLPRPSVNEKMVRLED